MSQLLQIFILLPLLGYLVSVFIPRKRERLISRLAIGTLSIYLLLITSFIVYWLIGGAPMLDAKHLVIFKAAHLEIFIDFFFDKVTAVYALVGGLVSLMVAVFSKYYLHRDEGFKRFFNILLLFAMAYNLIIFSGNFETLFIGWEFLGISSFLLIAFYRDRYLPVKNGMKVISIYRLGDICLILVMWMSHQLWHENITFVKLHDAALLASHVQEHYGYALFIGLMLFVAAATKSAQFPFSSWLPRAMEGPTSSSAIFYGSLSVHLGVFLLLRTYPYWEGILAVKVIIIAVGLLTSLVASGIARVQSTVKTQIAYASIAQIGIMFIEVALGWHLIALIHFAGNAFLRTYQLLVSPSVLSYLIHDMVFHFRPAKKRSRGRMHTRLLQTLYVLSIKEWNMDWFQYKWLWSPFKWIGNRFSFLTGKLALVVFGIFIIAGIYLDLTPEKIPEGSQIYFASFFALAGLMLILRAFVERGDARQAWVEIFIAQLFLTLAIGIYHEEFGQDYMLIYLSGSLLSSAVGLVCLTRLRRSEPDMQLNRFHGHSYEYPGLGLVFLICCLGLIGFPFTPTFVGIDLLFSHIQKGEIVLIVLVALSFLFMEMAILRIYSRIFMGQHIKPYHPIAYRSS